VTGSGFGVVPEKVVTAPSRMIGSDGLAEWTLRRKGD
jgi:hypothetical protein